MINIKVTVANGKTHILIDGHAGSAPHGLDIVCAAISAISGTAVLGLQAVSEQYPDYVHIEVIEE